MKKTVFAMAAVVAVVAALGLFGCSSSSSSSAASASGSASAASASASAASESASATSASASAASESASATSASASAASASASSASESASAASASASAASASASAASASASAASESASAASQSASAASESASAASASASAASEPAAEIDGSAYGYAGDDPEVFAIYKHLSEEVGQLYGDGDITVPVVRVFYKDYTNPDEVLEFGDFWLFKYNINGDTLEIASGGNTPGVMHLTKEGDGYVVSAFDRVTDGAGFDPSARELFGEYVDDFFAIHSDSETRDEDIKIAVSDYVNLNGLDITQFTNNGSDMVPLYKG